VVVSRPDAPLHPGALAEALEFEAFLAAHARCQAPPPPAPTTPASGSIRRAPPAAPRARCTRTPTPTGRPSCTARPCWACAKRRLLLGRQAVLRLRPGQCAELSDERGRHHAADGRTAHARCHLQALDRRRSAQPSSPRSSSARPPALPACWPRPRCRRAARWRCAWPRRPAKRCRPNWASASSALRRRHRRRHRLHRDAAHLPVQPARRVRYGTTGWPVPGYDIELRGDDGRPGARRRDRRPLHPRPERRDDVLGQPREDARDLPGRLDQERRQVRAQRRRQLHLQRPQRRHAQGQRHLRQPLRGRGHAGAAPGGAGGGGDRRARRRGPDQDQGLRRAEGGARPRGRAEGLREGPPGALQVPAPDRVRAELPKTATGKIQRFKLREQEHAGMAA
jgi:hypothetical protein